jgi:hypothetical protein
MSLSEQRTLIVEPAEDGERRGQEKKSDRIDKGKKNVIK